MLQNMLTEYVDKF